MNRRTLIFAGFCLTTLILSFCAARSFSRQQPLVDENGPRIRREVTSDLMNHPAEPLRELNPYVESLRTARAQGTLLQFRNEMLALADYCNEQPHKLGEVLHDLSLGASHDSTFRIFGEVLLKGRGQSSDTLVQQTASLWSQQTSDPAQRHLGMELLKLSKQNESSPSMIR